MAFLRYANAAIVKPDIKFAGWDEVKSKSQTKGNPFADRAAAKVVFQKYDPSSFMLSHCTIIASVDTEESPAELGDQVVAGFPINRKYKDWLIAPKTSKYINNNHDAWERKLLLSCFRTFIGGENYVEHIQIPEMSRGKIIDAAARDIGDSIYVDILVATDRKHRPLISAITSGQLQTLSMGCQVEFTVCTKCGNVAYDETQLCPDIRYAKGNEWVDDFGNKRRIAELCGHIADEPGSVKFIEASWVANPAFTGAVLRSILSPEEIASYGGQIQAAFAGGTRVANPDLFQKAAYSLIRQAQFGGDDTQEKEDVTKPPTPAPKAPEKAPFDKAVDDLAATLQEKALEKVRGDMAKSDSPIGDANNNDNLIKSALRNPIWKEVARSLVATVGGGRSARQTLLGLILLKTGGWGAVQASKMLSGREILAVSRIVDLASKRTMMAGEGRIYRAVVAVGGTSRYRDVTQYMTACCHALGREPSEDEKKALLVKGQLFSLGA